MDLYPCARCPKQPREAKPATFFVTLPLLHYIYSRALWNSLPDHIKSSLSLSYVKSNLDSIILSLNIHSALCAISFFLSWSKKITWSCYGVHITVCMASLVFELCQPVHSCIEPSLHQLDFSLFRSLLWRLVL